jgi:hypothetical protein
LDETLTDEELFKIIKKHCPVNLSYRQDGGLLDPCKIEGTLGDVLDFVKAIREDAYQEGFNEGTYQESYHNSIQ